MTFVLLYGPPAVGKLTVANELAKLTDFKVFHNHLSIDLVEAVFPEAHRLLAELSKPLDNLFSRKSQGKTSA